MVAPPLFRDVTRYSPDDNEASDVLSVDRRRISSSSVASRGRLLVLVFVSMRESLCSFSFWVSLCCSCWGWSSSSSSTNGVLSSLRLGWGEIGSWMSSWSPTNVAIGINYRGCRELCRLLDGVALHGTLKQ